jgi:hypothetical protein
MIKLSTVTAIARRREHSIASQARIGMVALRAYATLTRTHFTYFGPPLPQVKVLLQLRSRIRMLFDTLERAVNLIKKTTISTGLKTTVNVIKRLYETGRNATAAMKQTIKDTVLFHKTLPKWNYTISPNIGH